MKKLTTLMNSTRTGITKKLEAVEGKWKLVIGIILIVIGITLGLYVGLWVCFIGGIAQVINEIKSPVEMEGLIVAVGIAKMVFAAIIGLISAGLLMVPGGISVGLYIKERFL